METQSDTVQSLLADVRRSMQGDYSPECSLGALLNRGVALIESLESDHSPIPNSATWLQTAFARSLLPRVVRHATPNEILDMLNRIEPPLGIGDLYEKGIGWNRMALDYVAKLQAALKEKKENG